MGGSGQPPPELRNLLLVSVVWSECCCSGEGSFLFLKGSLSLAFKHNSFFPSARRYVEASKTFGMSMDITFLGTGSAYPSPTRGASALVLRREGECWLFDCGEGTQTQLMRSQLRAGACGEGERVRESESCGAKSPEKIPAGNSPVPGSLIRVGASVARGSPKVVLSERFRPSFIAAWVFLSPLSPIPGRITKIFITHLHGDHFFGLPGLLCTLSLQGSPDPPKAPVDIYGPLGLRSFVRRSLELSHSQLLFPYVVHELVPTREQCPAEEFKDFSSLDGDEVSPQGPAGRRIHLDPVENCYSLVEEEQLVVKAFRLFHRVPSFGFVVEEKPRPGKLNVQKLKELGNAFRLTFPLCDAAGSPRDPFYFHLLLKT